MEELRNCWLESIGRFNAERKNHSRDFWAASRIPSDFGLEPRKIRLIRTRSYVLLEIHTTKMVCMQRTRRARRWEELDKILAQVSPPRF